MPDKQLPKSRAGGQRPGVLFILSFRVACNSSLYPPTYLLQCSCLITCLTSHSNISDKPIPLTICQTSALMPKALTIPAKFQSYDLNPK